MANRPGNRQLVSSLLNLEKYLLTICSIPLRSRFGVWRPLRGSFATRRPSQDSTSAIWSWFSAHHHPRDLQILQLHILVLARHPTLGAADRLWLCHLLHESECPTPECCAIKPFAVHWCLGERLDSNLLLGPAEAVEPREPHNGSHS